MASDSEMGIRSRMTRESLQDLPADEFEAFLDDVAEKGLVPACGERLWTVGATLNWLRSSDDRQKQFEGALAARAEIRFHEGGAIVDAADADDVAVAKLRSAWRRDEAKVFSRERYGDRVAVDKAVAVGVDAGLIGFAGALLEKLAGGGRVVSEQVAQEAPARTLLEAEAPETVPEATPVARVSSTGALPPKKSPGRSVIGPI